MSNIYLNMTDEDKHNWIDNYVERRLAEGFNKRGKRYGDSKSGTISARSLLRKKARVELSKKIKRAKKRIDHDQAKGE